MVKKISGGWHKARSSYNPAHHQLEANVARILATANWHRPEWRAQYCEAIAGNWLEGRCLPRALCSPVREAIAETVRLETQAIELPELTAQSPAGILAYRARLTALTEFSHRADKSFAIFAASLGKIMTRIADAIPANIAPETSPFKVALIDLIEDPQQLVAGLVRDLSRLHPQNPAAVLPGSVLANAATSALLKFNKTTEEAARKNPFKIISPQASGLTGTELVKAFLPEPFATLLATPVPFMIARKKLASHSFGAAPIGHGKTQLTGTLAYTLMLEPDPPAIFLLDPPGDLFKHFIKLDVFAPGGPLAHKLVILDATDPFGPPPINFLNSDATTDIAAEASFEFLLASQATSWTPLQATTASYLLKLLRRIKDTGQFVSLDTLLQILSDKARSARASLFADIIETLDKRPREFFHDQFFEGRMHDTKQSMGWKIFRALDNPTFASMCTAQNCIDVSRYIAEKKIVAVNGGDDALGPDGLSTFFQFLVGQFYVAAFKRKHIPEDDRHLALMLIDEAHYVYKSPVIGNILKECRKLACGLFSITQLIDDIPADVKAAVFGATATRFSGPIASGPAGQFAKEMYCDPSFLRSMKAVERSHTEWALQVQGVTNNRAIRVTHPLGIVERAPKMTNAQLAEVRRRNHAYLTASQIKPQPSPLTAVPAAIASAPAPKTPPGSPWNSATEDEV